MSSKKNDSSIQGIFQKHLEALTDQDVQNGFISFQYMRGAHIINVTINVSSDVR